MNEAPKGKGKPAPGKGSGTLDKSPLVDAQAVMVARRSRFNPLRNWSPQSLGNALDAFENGYLREADTLWRTISRRDDVLKGVKPKREKAVTRRTFEVVMSKESRAAKDQKKALEFFWNHATGVDAFDRNDRGGFSSIARFHLLAQSYRYSAMHLVWKPMAKGLTAEFEWIPTGFFENLTGELRWLGPQGTGIEGTAIDPTNWIVCAGEGLMEPCSIAYGFKSLSYQDWVAYNEKFGIPFVIGKTQAAKDSAEWDAMVECVGGLMNDGAAVMSTGSEIEGLTLGATGSIPFPQLIERCDRAMTSLYLGSDLASMSRGGSGNSGASVQGGETVKIEADDCAWLSEQLQRTDKRVLEYLFGEGVEILACTEVRGPVTRDVTRDLEIDKALIGWGVPTGLADLAEKYGRSLPDEGEDLVKPPSAKPEKKAPPSPENEQEQEQEQENEREQEAATNERATATVNLREAINEDLQPLRKALADALRGEDAQLTTALTKLDAEWPSILEAVLAGDSAEKAIESRLGIAFVSGLDLTPGAPVPAFTPAIAGNSFNPMQARDLLGRWVDQAETLGGSAGPRQASKDWHAQHAKLTAKREELTKALPAAELAVRQADEDFAKWVAARDATEDFDPDDPDTWGDDPDAVAAREAYNIWAEDDLEDRSINDAKEAAYNKLAEPLIAEWKADSAALDVKVEAAKKVAEKAAKKLESLRDSLVETTDALDSMAPYDGNYDTEHDPAIDYTAVNDGTSDGARKGWEARRRGQSRPREGEGRRKSDAFGVRASASITPEENLERGQKAVAWALRNRTAVRKAMWRGELGPIDFPWGTPGDQRNDFKGGHGLSHILAKHGKEDVQQLPDVIVKGTLKPHTSDPDKRLVEHDRYRAVLTMKRTKSRQWWVLTGYTES